MFFKNLFNKKKKQTSSDTLIIKICSSLELLLEKSTTLNENFNEEKNKLQTMNEKSKLLVPIEEILSAKMEQELLTKITSTSFACDMALTGSENDFCENLNALETLLNQRLALQNKS